MYTVKTLDTTAIFAFENAIILKSLILNGKERAIEHKIALPKKYICDAYNLAMPDLQPSHSGDMKYFNWEFHSARATDNGVDILLIDKYAKCRYDQVVTGKCIDFCHLSVLVFFEFPDPGSQHPCSDERTDTADHVDAVGACIIVESPLDQESAAPGPVCFDRIDDRRDHA